MLFTLRGFRGGVHLSYHKDLTQHKLIRKAKIPSKAIIPLSQHIGNPCRFLVKVGDKVNVGTKLAEAEGFISSPIHSSISGTVRSIANFPHPVIGSCLAAVIEGDGRDELESSIIRKSDVEKLSPDELINIIRDSGIVGLGGAAFPTHVKLTSSRNKSIDSFILNGAECEPYITCDHRLMIEKGKEILKGIAIITKILDITKAYIAIESNKPDAVKVMQEAIREVCSEQTYIEKNEYGERKQRKYSEKPAP